jgi:hypothetical protein
MDVKRALYPDYEASIVHRLGKLRAAGASEANIKDVEGFITSLKAASISPARQSFYIDRLRFYEIMTSHECSEFDILVLIEDLRSGCDAFHERALVAKLLMDWHKLRHGLRDSNDKSDDARDLRGASDEALKTEFISRFGRPIFAEDLKNAYEEVQRNRDEKKGTHLAPSPT